MGYSWRSLSDTMEDIVPNIPEISGYKNIPWTVPCGRATVANKVIYELLIIGSELLEKLCIDLTYSDQIITWDGISIPMKERGTLTVPGVIDMLL